MDEYRKSYSEELKRNIVSEIESGRINKKDAAEMAHTTMTMVEKWLETYGRFKPKRDIVEVVMKSEKDKIAELEKALAETHLKLRISEKIVEIASRQYKVDLKKSFGTALSDSPDGASPRQRSKRSAKRRK